ncbi:MAG TPA: hypothetical protein VGQ76_00050 [Thermoanaerobaculia bacterium]|nr:hypothetical protein [Thermoanaerobaculia bacterium]
MRKAILALGIAMLLCFSLDAQACARCGTDPYGCNHCYEAVGDGGLDWPANEWQWIANTDAQGRATVHFASGDASTMIFIIPRSGSLGFVRLSPEENDVASVTHPRQRIARSTHGEHRRASPSRVRPMRMRINGTVIPGDVVSRMAQVQGLALFRDAAGRIAFPRMPPGQYDILAAAEKIRRAQSRLAEADRTHHCRSPAGPQTVMMKFRAK